MSEKQFVPQDWQNLENKQSAEKYALAKKHSDEKASLVEDNHTEALEMNVKFDEAKAKLEEITGKKIEATDPKMESSVEQLKKDWQNFYQEVFGMETDFSKLEIPKKQEGFDKLLVMAEGLDAQKIFAKCKEFFQVDEKDLSGIKDLERKSDSAYAIWVRDRVEADEENKNLSANEIEKSGMTTQTLREHLLQELEYFKKTGQHLDMQNWTLCAGSRYAYGAVPYAYWVSDDGQLRVDWHFPGGSNDHLRARQIVS